MSTSTTNYGLTKPDLVDPVDIDVHWSDNLDTADTELTRADPYVGDRAYVMYQLVSDKTLPHSVNHQAITGPLTWERIQFANSVASVIDSEKAINGVFQFPIPGMYRIGINAQVTSTTSFTEALHGLELRRTDGAGVGGLNIKEQMEFWSGRISTINATTIVRVSSVDLTGNGSFVRTTDEFNIMGLWQSNPTSTGGIFEAGTTWIQVQLLQRNSL